MTSVSRNPPNGPYLTIKFNAKKTPPRPLKIDILNTQGSGSPEHLGSGSDFGPLLSPGFEGTRREISNK